MDTAACDLVLPCRDEGPALRALLHLVPPGYRVIVVDNGSVDDTAAVARAQGASVVHEPRPGYGAAVHAGIEAATAEYVAVMDGDGSFDPRELPRLLDPVRAGEVDMALGRRRPVARGVWPWHARGGNAVVVRLLRASGFPAHDLAPMRVCRREALLALDVRDRRFGYPLELMRKAVAADWRLAEYDVSYGPRAAGTRSKVSGSLKGTVRVTYDFCKVLAT
ncbi:MAG TPA: glycosyltransferase family 2 protein [Nocardioides sp.]|nr:glycosyltransferase family 2 protein [Nocardioides sp.]